jgi:hypothetical protein
MASALECYKMYHRYQQNTKYIIIFRDIMHHSIMVMSTSRKVIFCWVSITWIRQTTYSWHLALCFIISGWFLLFKYVMTRTRYVWRTYNNKWVNDCCVTPTQQFFSYIIWRTSKFLMIWWWGLLCTRQTRRVGFL